MNWKVYDISLKKHEPFHFYYKDGKLINVSNIKNPRPYTITSIWMKDNKFGTINNPNKYIESIIVPTWLTETEYVNEAFLSQIPSYVEHYYRKEERNNHNLFLIHKTWDDYTEIGMALWQGVGTRRNRNMEKLIKRLDGLRAFS